MTDLSPAAQAVLDAFLAQWDVYAVDDAHHAIAAALHAAADRVKRGPDHWDGSMPDDYDLGWNDAVRYLITIAVELEGAQ